MRTLVFLFLIFSISSCDSDQKSNNLNDGLKLPYLGEKKIVDGVEVPHTISDFEFMDQDSNIINNATFKDKIYVVDFFFTHCPTICPKVKQQMLRIYEKYENDDRVVLLSHTIDTPRDTVPRLKVYANRLEAKTDKWHFVTGDKDKIYQMAKEYFISAREDEDAPGGYDHSGSLIVVDKNRHVRTFCNGLKEDEVSRMMNDMDKLLNET